ncbi:tol-pal system protein YbgF [Lysobacter antibioticus]|uniref:Cell division coordinator CpoB n=1 Tax=Lysobacter antibioticus TaxID=84531 RepID=A0A0S2DWB3_LYSAN|nr:tol-pal system protein YbgF [Lysobacter antibioticus]ALN62809.1 tol-pal system protein YbgF [Lysobacter antibioticus]ALN79421.1 tol-pal system protein YbgF [Lysobacter antibioticus]
MRKFALALAIAAACLAATPAFAQRASLADRVAVLEQRASDNQANLDLLNQVTQLKTELQALRAQVEELQQTTRQLQDTNKAQYLDTDNRLNRLEGGVAPSAPAAAPQTPPTPSPSAAVRDSAPVVHGDAGLLAQSGDERGAYDTAFSALKAGQYVESARLFQAFLANYPSGAYAPNALYWLGESYYVTQNYQLAQEEFQTLLDRYPTHDKAAGALLKVGLAQFGLKQVDAAERTLADVATRYPGTDAARTASDRLNAIQLSRLRN